MTGALRHAASLVSDEASRLASGPELTDVGNAERFAEQHLGAAVWLPAWNSWLTWDGRRWLRDEGALAAMALAKRTAATVYDDLALAQLDLRDAADDRARVKLLERRVDALLKWAARSQSEARLRSMLALAPSVEGMAITAGELDADLSILNTASGIVDLATGELRQHDPAAFCTKMTAAAYDPHAATPRWDELLAAVSCGDGEWQRYMQRLLGLALTGNPGERILPICHGVGANGKTTFFDALVHVLGDYASTGNAEAILLGKSDGRPQEDIADLLGKRLVVLPELPQGRLNTNRVKRLTGGDRIRANRKYEHAFEFEPTHTFVVHTNDRPQVPETGRAIWERLRPIPFDHVFEGDGRKPRAVVKAELAAEAPGILAWCVRGAVEYLREGLGDEPDRVRVATAEYEAEEDVIGRFLAECTAEAGADGWTASRDLYSAYVDWCVPNRVKELAIQAFGRELVAHGVESDPVPRRGKRGYVGIRLETGDDR